MSTNVTDVATALTLLVDVTVDDWRDQALCAQTDPEAFFPEKGGSTRSAKKVCQTCAVREQCLQAALANDERFGIWGGLSERERRAYKHRSLELTKDPATGQIPLLAAPVARHLPEGTAA